MDKADSNDNNNSNNNNFAISGKINSDTSTSGFSWNKMAAVQGAQSPAGCDNFTACGARCTAKISGRARVRASSP